MKIKFSTFLLLLFITCLFISSHSKSFIDDYSSSIQKRLVKGSDPIEEGWVPIGKTKIKNPGNLLYIRRNHTTNYKSSNKVLSTVKITPITGKAISLIQNPQISNLKIPDTASLIVDLYFAKKDDKKDKKLFR